MVNFNPFEGIGPVGPLDVPPPGTPRPETDIAGNPTGRWITTGPNGSVAPYRAPSQGGAGDTSAQVDGAGVPYVIRGGRGYTLDGQPYTPQAMPVNPHPGTSYSFGSSTSQNYQDPAIVQIQRDELAQRSKQFDAQFTQKQQELNAQIALQQQTLDFNKSKEGFAQSQDNKRLAMQAQQQAFGNQLQITQLTAQQAQMQAARDQFNAEMAQRAAQANMQYQEQAKQREANSLRDIAQFSQQPSDYGKVAAYLTANKGFGQAQGVGQDFTSQQSLQPLQGALTARDQAQREAQYSPYAFQPLPALNALDLSALSGAGRPGLNANRAPGTDQTIPGMSSVIGGGATPGNNPIDLARLVANASGPGGAWGFTGNEGAGAAQAAINAANAATNARAQGALPKMADGGMAQGAFIAGEDGEELIIPIAEGQALVLNKEQQAKMKPDELKRLKKMADGGIFSGGSVLNLNQNTDQARQFLRDATQQALGGTPFAGGLPAPIYASSPGTSPLVAQMLGSISGLSGGLPTEEYLRQAQMFRPTGVNERAIGRSA